ncbi:CBS domain protein [Paraperlucidibaca baekdonensis]|uniref:CBS domain protein n=1 Tax=Paraperlucidibaca baekdonensis TaxID=748120 RepID=A0A3E0H5B9_9GAMM|nr:transporter associated domain-containing protein [Paraperlucidibaca baekdonensis]REH37642.1 CBS domain protein [Paraperlucidibaca baekdonensis]
MVLWQALLVLLVFILLLLGVGWRSHPHWLAWLAKTIGKRPSARLSLSKLVGRLLLPPLHQRLLQGLLDLDHSTVNDIMIPRQAVSGIDLDGSDEDILQTLKSTMHTRLPVFHGDLNQTVGILHVRNTTRFLGHADLNKAAIMQFVRSPYFLPERTPLPTQLLEFQKQRRRLGLVVDEYGDVQGIVTLEAILEELVGEFTTRAVDRHPDISATADGARLIDGAASLRAINRTLGWALPVEGPRTLNGLLLDRLEAIPDAPVCLRIADYFIEVRELRGHLIRSASIWQAAS